MNYILYVESLSNLIYSVVIHTQKNCFGGGMGSKESGDHDEKPWNFPPTKGWIVPYTQKVYQVQLWPT